MKQRVNALYGRRESTRWTDKETKQLRLLAKRSGVLEELAEIEELYNYGTYQYRRRDVMTFLNNFTVELDRARTKCFETKRQEEIPREPNERSKNVDNLFLMQRNSWRITCSRRKKSAKTP